MPIAWTGGIVDDVLARAGVDNVFADESATAAGTFSAEQLLAVDPDVVVLVGDGSVDSDAPRTSIGQQFPDWPACSRRPA